MSNTVTYVYVGNDFTNVVDSYTTSDSVSGYITLGSALAPNLIDSAVAPLDFSFTDGIKTINASNGYLVGQPGVFPPHVSTDAEGDITGWYFQFRNNNFNNPFAEQIFTYTADPSLGITASIDEGSYNPDPYVEQGYNSEPGIWSSVSDTPEPSSALLASTALLALAFVARERNSMVCGQPLERIADFLNATSHPPPPSPNVLLNAPLPFPRFFRIDSPRISMR
jgi:hypothetical protein